MTLAWSLPQWLQNDEFYNTHCPFSGWTSQLIHFSINDSYGCTSQNFLIGQILTVQPDLPWLSWCSAASLPSAGITGVRSSPHRAVSLDPLLWLITVALHYLWIWDPVSTTHRSKWSFNINMSRLCLSRFTQQCDCLPAMNCAWHFLWWVDFIILEGSVHAAWGESHQCSYLTPWILYFSRQDMPNV